MNPFFYETWRFAAPAIVLCAHVAAGVAAGLVFFRALWWNSQLIVGGGSVSTAVALTLSRILIVGGLMTLSAFEGAAPLAASFLGVLIARFFVLRSIARDQR